MIEGRIFENSRVVNQARPLNYKVSHLTPGAGYFTLFGSRGGGGGDFEVKEGHPDFLQITWFFLNAVLLLYFKLFTCLEIITMLK